MSVGRAKTTRAAASGSLGIVLVALLSVAPACGGSSGPRNPALASQAPTREDPAGGESDGTTATDNRTTTGRTSSASGNGEDREDPALAATAVDAPPPPDERPVLETLTGRASYYADRFHGRSTASGEPYDMHALTAASRDLPFGTVVRVVRVDTGASVIVRVNDRGPFRDHSRILDLSRAAAEALDMIRAGVVEIRAEILERGDGRRWRAAE